MLRGMSEKREHPNDPLHGVTLETMLNDLVDFYGWDETALKIIRRISAHNDIICSMIFDPLERDITSARQAVASDVRA